METQPGRSDPVSDHSIPSAAAGPQSAPAYDPSVYDDGGAAQRQGNVPEQLHEAKSPYGHPSTPADPGLQSDAKGIADVGNGNPGVPGAPSAGSAHLQHPPAEGHPPESDGQQQEEYPHRQSSSLQQQQHQSPYHQYAEPQQHPHTQRPLSNIPGGTDNNSSQQQPPPQALSIEGYQPQSNPQYQSSNQQTAHKVFCGGLSFQTDEDKLREYFERLGTVVDVVIMRDRMSGHPRGFGFVSFAEEAVAKDVASRRHDIDGRQVEAKIAIPRNQVAPGGGMRNGSGGGSMGGGLRHGVGSMDGSSGGMGSALQGGSRPNTSHLNKIFVGGLPSQVGETEFSQYFQQFGEVTDAQVMIDHQTGNSRGFGFISFADQSSVELVVGPGRSSTRHSIMGKTVEVKRAEPKGASGGDRRSRDSYNVGGQRNQYGAGGGLSGSSVPAVGTAQAGGASQGAASGASYGSYNYPASVMEQYGQYYNNPQWQQYYANMGYNMQAYPQGFNPYTYYAAYMNNAATGGATPGDNDGSGTAGSTSGDANTGLGAHGGGVGVDGGGHMRGVGGYGSGSNGNPNIGMGGGAQNGPGGGAGAGVGRRASRRDDRYHPYR